MIKEHKKAPFEKQKKGDVLEKSERQTWRWSLDIKVK